LNIIVNLLRRTWAFISLAVGFAVVAFVDVGGSTGVCIGLGVGLIIYFGGLALISSLKESSYFLPPAHANSPSITSLLAKDAHQWRRRFSGMNWLEEIRKDTHDTLMFQHINLDREILICVAYSDLLGTHIDNVSYNGKDISSSTTALIITTKRLIIVSSAANIASSTLHEAINNVEWGSLVNGKKTYAITTKSGNLIVIEVNFIPPTEIRDESTVDTFLGTYFP